MLKNLFLLSLFLLIPALFIYSQNNENTNKTIKRTVLILPVINANKIDGYDYLSYTISATLESELQDKNRFNIVNAEILKEKIVDFNTDNISEYNIEYLKKYAKKVKADVVLYGIFNIHEENIKIIIKAFDIFRDEIVLTNSKSNKIDLNMFWIIDEISNNMAEEMVKEFPEVNKSYFDEMRKIIKQEYKLYRKKKIIFTPYNKTATGLFSSGVSLAVIGLPILLVGVIYYSPIIVKQAENDFLNSNDSDKKLKYEQLQTAYNYETALLASSISLLSLGFVLGIISIPLFIIKKNNRQNTKSQLKINLYNNYISFSFSLKI